MTTSPAGWALGPDGAPGPLWRACLEAAIAAPSIHNTQPWLFRLDARGVQVLADPSRQVAVIDPQGREMVISIGAAVLNLRVAMLAHGRTPLLRLLPDPEHPEVLAQVDAGPSVHTDETVRLLAEAIPRRRTNRRPFATVPVPAEVLADLSSAAAAEGGRLSVVDAHVRDSVLGLVRAAEQRRREQSEYWVELDRWTRRMPGRRDGVPAEAFGPWSALESVPLRDFGLVQPARRRWAVPFEPDPTIAVLYTGGDGQAGWLRAGQALQRTLLTATVHGLASTLMTQPLEFPQLRALLGQPGAGLTAQAVIRLGYGPPTPVTPRRPLSEVLVPPVPAASVAAEPGRVG